MKKLTEREIMAFDYLTKSPENLSLTKTLFNGIETTSIVIMQKFDPERYDITPIAIIVNEEIFSFLQLPEKDVNESDQ